MEHEHGLEFMWNGYMCTIAGAMYHPNRTIHKYCICRNDNRDLNLYTLTQVELDEILQDPKTHANKRQCNNCPDECEDIICMQDTIKYLQK